MSTAGALPMKGHNETNDQIQIVQPTAVPNGDTIAPSTIYNLYKLSLNARDFFQSTLDAFIQASSSPL